MNVRERAYKFDTKKYANDGLNTLEYKLLKWTEEGDYQRLLVKVWVRLGRVGEDGVDWVRVEVIGDNEGVISFWFCGDGKRGRFLVFEWVEDYILRYFLSTYK